MTRHFADRPRSPAAGVDSNHSTTQQQEVCKKRNTAASVSSLEAGLITIKSDIKAQAQISLGKHHTDYLQTVKHLYTIIELSLIGECWLR